MEPSATTPQQQDQISSIVRRMEDNQIQDVNHNNNINPNALLLYSVPSTSDIRFHSNILHIKMKMKIKMIIIIIVTSSNQTTRISLIISPI